MTGCGVETHTADCLCDVRVTTPCPIMGRVSDGWMFQQVAERMNAGIPWDNRTVLDVLSKVVELYDMYRENCVYTEVSDISSRAEGENPFVYYARVKQTVNELASAQTGLPDIEKILEHVGLTVDQFMTAITYNRYHAGSMNVERLQQMIHDIQISSVRKICRDYNLNTQGSGKWVCTVFRRDQGDSR